MATKKRQVFLIDSDLLDQMTAMKARTGLSWSEQVRRGIELWLLAREWPVVGADGRKSQVLGHSLPPCIGLPGVEREHSEP